jgi:hypothetical protein
MASEEAPWLLDCRARWRPGASWRSTVQQAVEGIDRGEPGPGWARLAMVYGDSGATGVALIVALYGLRVTADRFERLRAHRDLCMLDLGLAATTAPGPVAIASLGNGKAVALDEQRLQSWLAVELAPFDGDLERAARFALELARARTGLRPDDPVL